MSDAWSGPGPGAWFGEAAPIRRRLAIALAISLSLHLMAVFGVRAGRGAGSTTGQSTVLMARLVPAQVEDDAQATVLESSSLRTANDIRDPAPPSPRAGGDTSRPAASGALPMDLTRTNYYYLASRLQRAPTATGDIDFEYPQDSPIRDGVVQARVLINARGTVDDAIVEAADPPGVFDAVAVKALLRARYSPGLLHNLPVASQLIVEIRYRDPGSSTVPGAGISLKHR